MSIGISPMVAPIASRTVNITGAFAPISKPDPMATIKSAVNSNLGKKVIGKVKDVIKFITEKIPVKGIVNKATEAFKKISDSNFIKKGVKFVKNIYDKIVDNGSYRKTANLFNNAVEEIKPVA